MFSKSKSKPASGAAQKQTKPAVPSIISADLTITGNLVSEGEVQIDGHVIGDIRTDALLIGEDARVTGEIVARRVRVHGRVDGQITAKSVTLAKTAHVSGDVIHEDLSIEKGAFLEGHCKRMEEATERRSQSTVREIGTPPVPSATTDKAAPAVAKPSNGASGEKTASENTKSENRASA
ncbi:MAG: polymer-forming cytoskeletal protein [Rhodospirillales bacterium]